MKAKPRRLEDAEQRNLMTWLELQRPAAFAYTIHVPNGGRRGAAEAGIFKALGTKPGVPDVLLFAGVGGFHGLAIEMKKPKAIPSDVNTEQRKWIARLRACGWRAEVAPGFDHARVIFEQYLRGEIPPDWKPWGNI